jgi:predicted DNA-binding transcriptional regulator AlpA
MNSTLKPEVESLVSPQIRRLGGAKAVASRTGMSWRTVLRYADAGLMPWGYKIGTLRRWDMDEIERWIAGGCRPVRKPGASRQ